MERTNGPAVRPAPARTRSPARARRPAARGGVEEPDTRERILDAAEELFAERGLAGVSMRDIAGRVGFTVASLYNHFPGKEALYQAVLARGLQPLVERLGELAERDPDTEVGERIIRGVMAHLAERPHLPRLIVHESATGGAHLAELARQWIRPLIERGAQAMERERRTGDSPWTADQIPFAITAWLHLVFGHFALAPLMREVLDRDPLAPDAIEHQTAFLVKLANMIGDSPRPAAETHPDSNPDHAPPRSPR